MIDLKEIRFGLPVGSLNHPQRAKTKDLLDAAGLYTNGYELGINEYMPTFTNIGYLKAVAVRPQRVPKELWAKSEESASSGLDIGITGGDWAYEGEAAGYPIKRLCALGYGGVAIYAAIADDLKADSVSEVVKLFKEKNLLVPTEYIYCTAQMLMNDSLYKSFYGERPPEIEIGGRVINKEDNPNPKVRVVYSEGTTELSIPSGFGQMIVENAQRWKTARANRLKVVGNFGRSYAGLYKGPHIVEPVDGEDTTWWHRIKYLSRKLRGAALSRKFNYHIFDFPKNKRGDIEKFMEEVGLFTVKPFIQESNDGNGLCETKILVPKDKDYDVVEGLEYRGGKAITTFQPTSLTGELPWSDEELDAILEKDL